MPTASNKRIGSLKDSKLKLWQAADVITIAYQLVLMSIIISNYSSILNAYNFLFYHILIILFLLILPYLGKGKIINFLRNWSPVLIIPTNFGELHYLVHTVNPIDLDSLLLELDLLIFSVHPTVWLEKLSVPWLTEYLQWIYSTFYFLPMILAGLLYKQGRFSDFYFFVFVIVLGFYLSYFGYFAVPAIGPRFTINHLQTQPVIGVWLTTGIRDLLNQLENIQRDAFPSGHTEITLLTMMYAKRYAKSYYYVLIIIGSSLIISTVYLRYHYVVDVIAGIVLAIIVYLLAPWLFNKIQKGTIFSFHSQNKQK
jgi:membrane-associated phospholipid phosphatase